MKKLIPIACILFGFISFNTRAQYVAIPDLSFANWLKNNGYAACMNGNNLDTTCNAVLTTTDVHCESENITNLYGIQYFKKLTILNCASNNLYSLPLLPNSLTSLNCSYNSTIYLATLPNSLKALYCNNNSMGYLPNLPDSLTYLDCTSNQLVALPVLPSSLSYLTCDYNQLSSLPALPGALNSLFCSYNSITSLPALPNL